MAPMLINSCYVGYSRKWIDLDLGDLARRLLYSEHLVTALAKDIA